MSSDPRFDVPISGAVADLLRRLFAEAVRDGRRHEFVAAFRTITTRLETSADTFGEEIFDLPGLGGTLRMAFVAPLSVHFTVHPGQRLVTLGTFAYARPHSR